MILSEVCKLIHSSVLARECHICRDRDYPFSVYFLPAFVWAIVMPKF